MISWAVECDHVTKQFSRVKALDDVTIKLAAGKIYGLVGRNGAGKTTLLHLLGTLAFPTAGQIAIFGRAAVPDSPVLTQVCLIRDHCSFPPALSVAETLLLAQSLYPCWNGALAAALLEEYELSPGQRIRQLSPGMKSSLGVVVGLSSRAPLTLFDEPTLGLDAAGRRIFYTRLLEDYSVHPRTLLLSTHLIDEISRLLDVVIIIDQGRILMIEERETLLQKSVYLSGKYDAVEAMVTGKNVLSREVIAGSLVAAVYDTLTEQERRESGRMGIAVQPIPLQETVVLLTSKRRERYNE